jgi:hypothetical protein
MASLRYSHPVGDQFVVEHLSDGSAAVFDRSGDAVHSLNPTAAAVWACCAEPSSVHEIRAALAEGLAQPLDAGTIEDALRQLVKAGLIQQATHSVEPADGPSRREALKRLAWGSAAVAVPVVLTLAGSEQRVLAQCAGSVTTNLAGCWNMTLQLDGGDVLLNITQAGSNLSGTVTDQGSFSGKLTGTICGAVLNLTFQGAEGTCQITGTVSSTNATSSSFSGSIIVNFGSGCGSDSNTQYKDTVVAKKVACPS